MAPRISRSSKPGVTGGLPLARRARFPFLAAATQATGGHRGTITCVTYESLSPSYQVICCGIIRGSGRPKLGLVINFVFYYCAALPLGITLAFYVFKVGLEGKILNQTGKMGSREQLLPVFRQRVGQMLPRTDYASYSPGLKYTTTFIPLRICHTLTFKSKQCAGCLFHEPSFNSLSSHESPVAQW